MWIIKKQPQDNIFLASLELKEKILSGIEGKNKIMNSRFVCALFVIIILLTASCSTREEFILENSFTRLVLKDNRIASILDKVRNIEHVAPLTDSTPGLFSIQLVKGVKPEMDIDALQMVSRVVKKKSDELDIEYSHSEATARVKVSLSSSAGEILWSISVTPSNKELSLGSVGYPVFETTLTASGEMKQCLYPVREGLLQPLNEKLPVGECSYPAWLFSQLIGCLQKDGGFLLWTNDPDGHVKAFDCIPGKQNASFGVRHRMSYIKGVGWESPYQVRLSFCGDNWQDAADIYRDWASGQPFCKVRFRDREDIPSILHHPPLFINAAVSPNDKIEAYPGRMNVMSKRYDVPIIFRAVRWEKQQPWVGIDYFPPVVGETRFRKLADKLKESNIVLVLDISGFRWSIKLWLKNPNIRGTEEERNEISRLLEKYFLENGGQEVCETKRDGSLTPYWGVNAARICRGTTFGRTFLQNTAKQLFDLGATAFHDDQDVGMWPDGIEGCFNPDHGHPIPCGTWSTEVTIDAFRELRAEAASRGIKNFFISKEFCSELLNMEMHVHLSRSQFGFSGGWEEQNPFIIPLVNYLYHEYIPIGMEPSFGSSTSYKIAAATIIYGQLPGTGVSLASDTAAGLTIASVNMKLLEDYYNSMKVYSKDFLLYGKMLHPLVKNSPVLPVEFTEIRGRKLAQPFIFNEPLVIQSSWEDYLGNVGVFAVNTQPGEVVIQVPSPGEGKWQATYYLGGLQQQTQTITNGDSLEWRLVPGRLAAIVFKQNK